MTRKSDWQKKQDAINSGANRPEGIKAEPNQALTYVLSDKKFFAHASLDSARAEKEFLEAALGRDVRIYKVWNAQSSNIQMDMNTIRSEAEKLPKKTRFYKALNRILAGAGY